MAVPTLDFWQHSPMADGPQINQNNNKNITDKQRSKTLVAIIVKSNDFRILISGINGCCTNNSAGQCNPKFTMMIVMTASFRYVEPEIKFNIIVRYKLLFWNLEQILLESHTLPSINGLKCRNEQNSEQYQENKPSQS